MTTATTQPPTRGYRTFAFDPADQPMLDRLDAERRRRPRLDARSSGCDCAGPCRRLHDGEKVVTLDGRNAACRGDGTCRMLGGVARTDAEDTAPCPCEGCITHVDGHLLDDAPADPLLIGLDLRPAGKWLGAERAAELHEQDPSDRLVLIEALEAAARAAGETDPTFFAGIRGASLDDLKDAYRELPDPPGNTPEKETKTDMTDFEATARSRMLKSAHTAYLQPLNVERVVSDTPIRAGAASIIETVRAPTPEEQARIDKAEKAFDQAARFQRTLGRSVVRTDLSGDDLTPHEQATKAAADIKPDSDLGELEQLLAIAKRDSIPLQDLIRALSDLREMRSRTGDPRTDAAEARSEDASRAQMVASAQQAWTTKQDAVSANIDRREGQPGEPGADGIIWLGDFI